MKYLIRPIRLFLKGPWHLLTGVLCLFLFTNQVMAQKGIVTGFVTEAKTNVPLPGANVFMIINGIV